MLKISDLFCRKSFQSIQNKFFDVWVIVRGKFFGHAVGDDHANGQTVVSHHFAESIQCRRFHFEVAHAPALTVEGFNSWGHIGYGIRPSERRKGYAVQSLKLMLEQAKARHINRVLIGVHEGNVGSWKTVEKCGGILENTVSVAGDDEPIRRYWIKIQ